MIRQKRRIARLNAFLAAELELTPRQRQHVASLSKILADISPA
jgi:hypothetical protein